jgi:hypothetical protein
LVHLSGVMSCAFPISLKKRNNEIITQYLTDATVVQRQSSSPSHDWILNFPIP